MAVVTTIRGALCLTLLAFTPWQAAARITQNIPVMNTPTYNELSTTLIVNQMAILELMHNSLNTSCAAAEVKVESHADTGTERRLDEVMGTRMDRLLAALEVQQQHTRQVLHTLNTTAMDTLTKVEEVREEMREELAKIVQDTQLSASQAQEPQAAVSEVMDLGPLVHNDSLPSLCSGNKILHGTIGELEVVSSGTYPSSTTCSWYLNFPVESSVSLTWEYIVMESQQTCSYDWVQVTHQSLPVYGRKLCGTNVSSSMLNLLNVTLHKVRNLLVSFRSDSSNEYRGFKLLYQAY